MTRFNEIIDVSTNPPTRSIVPFTVDEEAAADAAMNNPLDYQLQRYQFLAMLTIANLASLVTFAIGKITDPVQKAVAQAKYDSTQIFQRDDPVLNLLASNAGLTSEQVDAYWLQAKDL